MDISIKFYETTFTGKDHKEAYLKACKWIASNIIANDEIARDVMWKVTKDSDLPTVGLSIYATLSDTEHSNHFCKTCKEFHRLFYINQQQNCNGCNMQAYRSQADEKMRIKKNHKIKLLSEKVLL